MDEKKIEELRTKRLRLQEEIRLNNLRSRVKSQIVHLEKLGQSYAIFYEFENLNWINTNVQVRKRDGYHGMHGDFQIDVDDSTVVNLCIITEEEINSEKFKTQFLSLIPEDSSLIVCYQGGDPEIEFSVKAFLNRPSEFLSRPETWILTTDKKCIIEYIWDQRVIRFIHLQESLPTLIKTVKINEK